jgi:hypothetical protein
MGDYKMRQYAYFDELPVKTHFIMNGNRWIKKSKTTAILAEYGNWFYFGRRELCIVGLYSRSAA